jgi:hypothetical protein
MTRFLFAFLAAACLLVALNMFSVTYQAFVITPARDAASLEAAREVPVVTDTLALKLLAPGERVLLEGQTGQDAPVTNFVIVQEYTNKKLDRPLVMYMVRSDGESGGISVTKEASPRFTLDLADGPVRIVNDDYAIISSWGYTTIDASSPVQGLDVRGIGPGKVALIGTVVALDDGIGIAANTVTDNPVDFFRVSHVDPDSRGWAQGFALLIGLAGGMPLLLGLLFGVLAWRSGRRSA